MSDIVFSKNSNYAKYEEMLIRRDNLKKEAFMWDREYINVFGDRMLKVFKIKISCIRKKKELAYCQRLINLGETLDEEKLQEYLREEMEAYQIELNNMIEDNDNAKKKEKVSEGDLLEIKKIYRRITKKLHPDINPKTNEDSKLMDLWNRVSVAYQCNNLKDLQELEVLVNTAVSDESVDVEIPDIENKIAEIEAEISMIRNTDPYRYQDILNDERKVADKNKELDEEYDSYKDYEAELDELIRGIKSDMEEM